MISKIKVQNINKSYNPFGKSNQSFSPTQVKPNPQNYKLAYNPTTRYESKKYKGNTNYSKKIIH